jgi:creatinine amidohydrolase
MKYVYINKRLLKIVLIVLIILIVNFSFLPGQSNPEAGKPLVLQEMTWTDVKAYLKTSDMVIIPIGSTEQHGPHLPLGSDFYEALESSKLISARTGVLVAPVVMAGYSVYHSGFPGTLSLKPETLEQVLFETAEMLIKYGFRRFMFFNFHGGNSVVESKVIHRINHSTGAIAVKIGIRAPFQDFGKEEAPFDYHSGIGETSNLLFLKPELVRKERIKKPEMTFNPKIKEIIELSKKYPALNSVLDGLLGVPVETGKDGASHQLSDNGIWTFGDPTKANKKLGQQKIEKAVDLAVQFIEAWKQVKK